MTTIADASTATRPTLMQISPQFRVPDVVRTAEWYRDHPGFQIGDYFHHDIDGKPAPFLVHVLRDGIAFQIGRSDDGQVMSNRDRTNVAIDAYLWVRDVGSLFQEFRARGVRFLYELHRTDYNMWEFAILDCDGHSIAFGE